MGGNLAMHNAPCPDFHQEKHVESPEPRCHHDKEIARDDGLVLTRINVLQFCEEVLRWPRRSGSAGQ